MVLKSSFDTFERSNLLAIHCNLSFSLINCKSEVGRVRQVDQDSYSGVQESNGKYDHEDHKAFLSLINFLKGDFKFILDSVHFHEFYLGVFKLSCVSDCLVLSHLHEFCNFVSKNGHPFQYFLKLMLVIDVLGKSVVDVRTDEISVGLCSIGIEFHFWSQCQVSDLKCNCFLLLSKFLSSLWSVLPMIIIRMVRKLNTNLVNFFKECVCSKIICTANLKVHVGMILDNWSTIFLINSHLRIAFVSNKDNLARLAVFYLITKIQTMLKWISVLNIKN